MKNGHETAVKRQMLRSKAWIRTHRPDVIDAIEKEVLAKFPRVSRGSKALPKSLAALK